MSAATLTADEVRLRMTGVVPDPIQVYMVEVGDTLFPPKQVIDVCVGFPRTSFITYEAVRVLNRLGFNCLRAEAARRPEGEALASSAGEGDPAELGRLGQADVESIRATLTTVQIVLASLNERVTALEKSRS